MTAEGETRAFGAPLNIQILISASFSLADAGLARFLWDQNAPGNVHAKSTQADAPTDF